MLGGEGWTATLARLGAMMPISVSERDFRRVLYGMVADDCRGVEVMLCGVDVKAGDNSNTDLGGGCQVAWAVELAEVILSLAVARMLAQVHS